MSDKMRDEFDKWWAAQDDDVNFGIIPRAIACKGWQASRAALVVELPAPVGFRSREDTIDDCRDAIHTAGVSTR